MNRPIAEPLPAERGDDGGLLLGYETESLLMAQKQALEMVVRGAPLRDVLSYLTHIVEQQAEGRVVASILLLDSQGCLHTGAAPSLPDSYNSAIDGLKARDDLGTCSAAAVTGEVVITPSFADDPKWADLKELPLALGLKGAWSQPVFARDGQVLGTFGTYFRECREPTSFERHLVGVLSNTAALAIQRQRADAAMADQRRFLGAVLDAADMGTWRYDVAGRICEFSEAAQQIYGVDVGQFLHDDAGVRRLLHPDDIPLMWQALDAACDPAGNGRYRVRYRVRGRDGGWRWLSVWGLTEFGEDGGRRKAVTVSGASRDITDMKEAERKQALLIDELSHRVKNTLAIVQSIASQTLRHRPDPAAFNEAFSARIGALAHAHDLLTTSKWQGAALHDLLAATLRPFGEERSERRVQVDGPALSVNPNTAVTLCLVFHELATNAAKYGALSVPNGRLAVTWRRAEDPPTGQAQVELAWHEDCGRPIAPSMTSGFGFRLIRASADQLGGTAHVDLGQNGLDCGLHFPLSAVQSVQ